MHWIHAVPLLAATALGTGCFRPAIRGEVKSRHEQDASGLGKVVVDSPNGAISIVCGPGEGPLKLEATRFAYGSSQAAAEEQARALEILCSRMSPNDPTLRIGVTGPVGAKVAGWSGADFAIEMPTGADLEVHTSNGKISITGARGELKLRTSNGAIEARDVAGRIEARTSNGRIVLSHLDGGGILCESSNGAIEVSGRSGDVSLKTSNGKVTLRLQGAPRNPNLRVSSSNGSIEIEVPDSVDADVRLQTSNGSISKSFGECRVTELKSSRTKLEARLGSGGGAIQAHTSNGSIRIRTDSGSIEPAVSNSDRSDATRL